MATRIESPMPPDSVSQAVAWIMWAVQEVGPGFHPDTPAADYEANGKPVFTKKSAKRFDDGREAAIELLPDAYATTNKCAATVALVGAVAKAVSA